MGDTMSFSFFWWEHPKIGSKGYLAPGTHHYMWVPQGSVAISHWGVKGAECPPWQRKICQKLAKRGSKSGKIGKEGKIGKKMKNREGSFTLPLLTDTYGWLHYCQGFYQLESFGYSFGDQPLFSWNSATLQQVFNLLTCRSGKRYFVYKN